MHRFIVGKRPEIGQEIEFSSEEAAHAFKVLRLKSGETVELSDGAGTIMQALLTEVSRERVCARVMTELDSKEAPVRLTLYQGYPKSDKMDLIAQKLTELGAVCVTPVVMARSVARPDGKDAGKKRERLQRIAQEAAKQCGRGRVLEVGETISWKQLLARIPKHELVLMPWEEARSNHLKDVRERMPGVKDIALVIGPEGGISPEEAGQALEAGAETVTLGPRILRTETAAVAASALVMCLWGDL